MLSIKVSLLEHRAGERRMEIGSGEVKRRYSAGSNPFPLQCQLLLLVQVKICLPVNGRCSKSFNFHVMGKCLFSHGST